MGTHLGMFELYNTWQTFFSKNKVNFVNLVGVNVMFSWSSV